MKATVEALTSRDSFRRRVVAGGAVLTLCAVLPAYAQRPVFSTAATRASMRPVVAHVEPEAGVPEPPAPGQGSSPEIKDDLFAGTEKFAKGASDVTEVTMDPNSLEMVNGSEAHKAHRMVLNVVRTYTYDKPGMYNPADVEEYRRKLETGDWHCSVHVRDLKSGEATDICSKRRAPDMIENAIITVEPKSLTFIHNIRKVNGQGGSLGTGGNPGFSMSFPEGAMDLPLEIQPIVAAEVMAATAGLRTEMPALMQGMKAFKFEMPQNMAMMTQGMKDFHFAMKPFPTEQFKQLEQQMRELQRNAPEREKELQQLQNQLKDLQKNLTQQP